MNYFSGPLVEEIYEETDSERWVNPTSDFYAAESYLSVCVCVYACAFLCSFVCSRIVFRPITSSCILGLENDLTQMIIMTRQCVAYKNHVARLKIKVTAHTYPLCIASGETCSCPARNFVLQDLI